MNEIYQATLDDIDKVLEIEQESFIVPWSRNAFIQELNNKNSYFFVTKINNLVVGYVILWHYNNEMTICNLAVKKEYRNQGIGKQLLNYAIEIAKNKNVSQIFLEVRTKNIIAKKLYESFGFKPIAIRKKYYRDNDAIIMVKEINLNNK